MSLDVYLRGEEEEVDYTCECCGRPGVRKERPEFFNSGVTHNLTAMANAVGLYQPVWHPYQLGISKAAQLIEPLRAGIAQLKTQPAAFKKYEVPDSGFGTYGQFVTWLETYLAACEKHPDATIFVNG